MGRFTRCIVLGVACIVADTRGQLGPAPISANWSSNHYGPDGPWPAITVNIGSQNVSVDLFPGMQTYVLDASVCGDTALDASRTRFCFAQRGGLYDSRLSTTLHGSDSVMQNGPFSFNSSVDDFSLPHTVITNGQISAVSDSISFRENYIPEVNFIRVEALQYSRYDGMPYPPTLGTFALGSSQQQAFWVLNETQSDPQIPTSQAVGNVVANYLYDLNITTSQSFGLHIGSVPLQIPGSLWFGGYDRSRALEDLLVFERSGEGPEFFAYLQDFGFGVAEGSSLLLPGGVQNLSLFPQGLGSQGVLIDPGSPYISLPLALCTSITKSLPVSYNSSYGLWLWNTTDPRYNTIISSPSYLYLTFQTFAGEFELITSKDIKIAFKLLNLTLSSPLVESPVQYLPIVPLENSPYKAILGRAFLQAAFLGTDWNTKVAEEGRFWWYLAQAPGPNFEDVDVVSVIPLDGTASWDQEVAQWSQRSSMTFRDSWAGHWVVNRTVPTTSAVPTHHISSDGSSGRGGLSTDTEIAIGLGFGIPILVVCFILICCRSRRSKTQRRPSIPQPGPPTELQHFEHDDGLPVYSQEPPRNANIESAPALRSVDGETTSLSRSFGDDITPPPYSHERQAGSHMEDLSSLDDRSREHR